MQDRESIENNLQNTKGEVASTTLGIPVLPGVIAFGLDPDEDGPVMFITIGAGLPFVDGGMIPLTLSIRLDQEGTKDFFGKVTALSNSFNKNRLADLPEAFLQAFAD